MSSADVIAVLQWFFLLYFIVLTTVYLLLNLSSFIAIRRYMQWRSVDVFPEIFSGLEPPVTVLVPAHNEARTIVASVYSLLQLEYREYEILVVNDGSSDDTLERLIGEFDLVAYPAAYWQGLPCETLKAAYRSKRYPNMRVLDKERGGKADALNAGINEARYPLFCSIDADSILQRDSLHRIVQPFLDDQRTVAAGGIVRIANGSVVQDGLLVDTRLPQGTLALIQVVEYLRAFLFGRMGWAPFNALLIISGTFGVFDRKKVIEAGGYRRDTVGEDMELVLRLHRLFRTRGEPYRITFVPDPVCWTEAPERWRVLADQRIRWQRGLSESLLSNLGLLGHYRSGVAGWVAFPFFLIFEWLGPLIEVLGYFFVVTGFAFGVLSASALAAFFILAIGSTMLLSVTALLLEEISFHTYQGRYAMLRLFAAAVLENLGYRQINSVWRVIGLWRSARGTPSQWGEMTRANTWRHRVDPDTRRSES